MPVYPADVAQATPVYPKPGVGRLSAMHALSKG